MSSSDWLKHVKTRFKLGLQKPQISKAIEELRNLNRDFVLITEQITRTLEEAIGQHRNPSGGTGRKQVKNLNALQRYHRIRQASQALYSTVQVRWVCEAHRCHSFDVRILDFDSDNGKDKGKSQASIAQCVTCELAITHNGSSYASRAPLRLEIEQACEAGDECVEIQQRQEDAAVMQQLTTALEENAARFPAPATAAVLANPQTASTSKFRRFFESLHKDSSKKKKNKKEQQQASGPAPAPQPAFTLPALSESLTGLQIHDACIQVGRDPAQTNPATTTIIPSNPPSPEDFCKTFNSASSPARTLLKSFNVPHSQWFSVPQLQGPDTPQIQSLSDMIRWIAKEPILRSLPRRLLVDVASNVAEGIMQFYSTPWLASSDLGEHVRFLKCRSLGDSEESGAQLSGPYFSARIESGAFASNKLKMGRGQIGVSGELARKTMGFGEARNQLLFNFGVLLLEVGFGRPWEELKCTVGAQTTPLSAASSAVASSGGKEVAVRLSDYRTAEKLAQLLVNQMGLAYPRVVKKCLGCDFGLGETDLENEDLQRRFVEDVVTALKQLREDMREMEL